MKKLSISITVILVLATLLSACGNNQRQSEAVATAIAQTVEAFNNQTPQITYVVVTPENTAAPLSTATPLPTSTALPTNTSIPAATASPRPCNAVAFVSENPLDGASYAPGATFTKSWRFKNTGTCTWNPNYKVVYANGSTITGADTKKLTNYVAPGETTDIVYTFKAPSKAGTYQTVFHLLDDKGNFIAQFWVNFKVKSTSPTSTATPAFAVTNVTFSSSDASISDTCPQTFDYSAAITTNAAGSVTYHFVFSNGATTTPKTLAFSGAGTKTVSGIWEINASGSYWVKLYIDEPNHQLFGTLNLSLTCTPAFSVTGVSFSSPPTSYDGDCSALAFDYQIDIAANGAGTVTYLITFSDGTSVGTDSLPFSSAGTQSVTGTWNIDTPVSDTYWFSIYIDNPNHQLFGPHNITVTCTP